MKREHLSTVKLGLCFGIVLAVFLISGLVTIIKIRGIGDHMRVVIDTKGPESEAAYEMEINLIGTGFGLLGYLEDKDPNHLERIKKDSEDFERYYEQYIALGETGELVELTAKLYEYRLINALSMEKPI